MDALWFWAVSILLQHASIETGGISDLALRGPDEKATHGTTFDALEEPKPLGRYTLRFSASGHVRIPHCASRGPIFVDGVSDDQGSKGPLVLPLEGAHDIRVVITASAYEKRIACSEPPRAGPITTTRYGISLLTFRSPHSGPDAGTAVLYVPSGHDFTNPSALLVGVHPWNGGPWTYAAYRELLEEADARDVVCIMPSGLGNSLYTADAEEEVLLAIATAEKRIFVDRQRVSIWGASMGGAGATTISFHHPDQFAFAASYFGDSKYDLGTYVKGVLGGEAGAHRVNALDIVENSRHLPVFLVHGEGDRSSPVVQSVMLFEAMKRSGFVVELERVPRMGHEGALVAKFLRRVVDRAANALAPVHPTRVSYRSVRAGDVGAYGVRFVRAGDGDAVVDLEKTRDGVRVYTASGVKSISLAPGALGATASDPILGATVPVSWDK